jgi:hypothetical protein
VFVVLWHTPSSLKFVKDRSLEEFQFCEWFLHKCDEWEHFQDSVVWSDENTFKLNDRIDQHNCVHWANENPHMKKKLSMFQE